MCWGGGFPHRLGVRVDFLEEVTERRKPVPSKENLQKQKALGDEGLGEKSPGGFIAPGRRLLLSQEVVS